MNIAIIIIDNFFTIKNGFFAEKNNVLNFEILL